MPPKPIDRLLAELRERFIFACGLAAGDDQRTTPRRVVILELARLVRQCGGLHRVGASPLELLELVRAELEAPSASSN